MIMPTPSLRRKGPSHAGGLVKPIDGTYLTRRVLLNPNSSMALDEICADINRSKKWAYACNLVPIYNDRGEHLNKAKTPPPPWEQLPAAIIKKGKKQWSRASVEAWKLRFYQRAEQSEEASSFRSMTQGGPRHD